VKIGSGMTVPEIVGMIVTAGMIVIETETVGMIGKRIEGIGIVGGMTVGMIGIGETGGIETGTAMIETENELKEVNSLHFSVLECTTNVISEDEDTVMEPPPPPPSDTLPPPSETKKVQVKSFHTLFYKISNIMFSQLLWKNS
jgi:hypothetical protein